MQIIKDKNSLPQNTIVAKSSKDENVVYASRVKYYDTSDSDIRTVLECAMEAFDINESDITICVEEGNVNYGRGEVE